ncbi:hypothetical protein LOD99_9076 [Oopsacas minuta]|uniref:Uncharacterized protein n=1 Tax=Oopsacas minuta TaxID=111878 RepID=A0AAV7JDX9_9METZ|nr:hypothetical protein LOD99_9076 [Oopsacas minuta]
MASKANILDARVDEIKVEIEMIFQNIIASFLERKNTLLLQLEERVRQSTDAYTVLMNEHLELVKMRDQLEESLNKNQYSDLRTDMLGPLQSRILEQEKKLHSEFNMEFTYTGFEHLINIIEYFGEFSFQKPSSNICLPETRSIPIPPPDIPASFLFGTYTHPYRGSRSSTSTTPHPIPVTNRGATGGSLIPQPPPDIPMRFLLGTYTRPHQTRGSISFRPTGGATPHRTRSFNRHATRGSFIPLPPPDIPRSFLLGTNSTRSRSTRGTAPQTYSRSTASNPRLRAFFSLLGSHTNT